MINLLLVFDSLRKSQTKGHLVAAGQDHVVAVVQQRYRLLSAIIKYIIELQLHVFLGILFYSKKL